MIKEHYFNTGFDVSYLFKNINSLKYVECNECNLKFFNPTVLGDGDYYAHLQKEDWYFLHEDKTEYEFSPKYIKNTDKVLDVGSGRGVFSRYIDCAFYQGLELSNKAIELAKRDGVNVLPELIQEHSKKKKKFYDVVVLFQVLEHIADIEDFVSSSLCALKKGGKLIIAVPNNDSFIKKCSNNFLNIPPHHQLHWNEECLKVLASIYKLRVVEIFKEKVTSIHRDWFYNVIEQDLLMKSVNEKHKIICEYHKYHFKKINKMLIGLYVKFLKLIKYHKNQDGHSIICVYEKL